MPTNVKIQGYGLDQYESNAEKREKEQKEREVFLSSISAQDLKFLKEFGGTTISLAGIYVVSKMLKK